MEEKVDIEKINGLILGIESLIDFKIQDLYKINNDLHTLKQMKEEYERRNKSTE